jgi:hypothetical protein
MSSSREEKVEWQPFHKHVCPGRTTGAGGCAKYSEGGVDGGCGNGVVKEGRVLVSDGDPRVERVGSLRKL